MKQRGDRTCNQCQAGYVCQRCTLITLLETIREVEADCAPGATGLGDGDRLPMMSRTWHEGSYQPLQDTLRAMRASSGVSYQGWAVRALYWHVNGWYVEVDYTTQPTVRYVGNRRIVDHDKRVRVPHRRCDARPQVAAIGVDWILEQRQEWWLPREIKDSVAA